MLLLLSATASQAPPVVFLPRANRNVLMSVTSAVVSLVVLTAAHTIVTLIVVVLGVLGQRGHHVQLSVVNNKKVESKRVLVPHHHQALSLVVKTIQLKGKTSC